MRAVSPERISNVRRGALLGKRSFYAGAKLRARWELPDRWVGIVGGAYTIATGRKAGLDRTLSCLSHLARVDAELGPGQPAASRRSRWIQSGLRP